jgi:peroxiredoxin
MIRKPVRAMILVGLASVFSVFFAWNLQAARVGQRAPDFMAVDTNGKTHSLSEFSGKYVVLEWTNNGCPYTQKHYASGNMQNLQRQWTSRGVVWLTVISSAQGEQGYMTGAQENSYVQKANAAPTAVLLDPKGTLGHLYDAKTTPDLFIINPQGMLIYSGAIDDRASTDTSDIKGARNYVDIALTEAMAGKQVTTAATRSYGCSVKY